MRIRNWQGRAVVVSLGCAGLVLLATACGGGSTTQIAEVGNGSVGVRVAWPEGKLIPAASQSIVLEIWKSGQPLGGRRTVINRPASSGRIDGVPLGQATLRAAAYPQPDGAGTAQAFGEVTIDVLAGYHDYGTLTMASTITRVAVTPNPALIAVGRTTTLTATSYDANNQVVLVPTNGPYTWSITAGSEFLQRDSSTSSTTDVGSPTAGTATVQATENESGVSGTATVTVATETPDLARQWSASYGTPGADRGVAICSYGSFVYLVGNVPGQTPEDPSDFLVACASTTGSWVWQRRYGSPAADYVNDIAVDSSGNLAVCGFTYGNLGANPAGDGDAFVWLLDPLGNVTWQRQIGASASDSGAAVDFDQDDSVWMAVETLSPTFGASSPGDILVVEISSANVVGQQILVGTPGYEQAGGLVMLPGSDFLLAGTTNDDMGAPNNLGGLDAFAGRWTSAGTPLWVHNYGTSADEAGLGLAVSPGGDIALVGWTQGAASGPMDAYCLVLDSSGNQRQWHQVGNGAAEAFEDVTCDADGRFVAVGASTGVIDASYPAPHGGFEMLVAKFDTAALLRLRQYGTVAADQFVEVTTDSDRNVYAVGYSSGNYDGHTVVGSDDLNLTCLTP